MIQEMNKQLIISYASEITHLYNKHGHLNETDLQCTQDMVMKVQISSLVLVISFHNLSGRYRMLAPTEEYISIVVNCKPN